MLILLTVALSEAGEAFAQINSDSLIAVYAKKMQKYLDKENKGSDIFLFTKSGIEIYLPATDTTPRKFENRFFWNEIDVVKNMLYEFDSKAILEICNGKSDPFSEEELREISARKHIFFSDINSSAEKPLKGLRICLDPGHIGGDIETARREKKWVEMKVNPAKGIKEPIQLIEGNLTYATAIILKNKLENAGAKVVLTRNESGISAFGISFEKWMDSLFLGSLDSSYKRGDISFEEKNFLSKKANDTEIFRRFFLAEDIRMRARKINAFNPDLTLIIHYNVDETNQSWNKPTKKNFNMAFVGGSFIAEELNKPEERIDFLRLLLSDDIDNSIEFSKYIVESLVQKTEVPAALDSCAIYLKGNCITTDAPGVFCRNLALTRMVKGTLCYGESLYQDNINECKALAKEEIIIDGIKTSKRVVAVAEAYFDGIINYMKRNNK